METCAPLIGRKFHPNKTVLNFPEKWLNPVVVLVDIALQQKRLTENVGKSRETVNSEENNNRGLSSKNESRAKSRVSSFESSKSLTSDLPSPTSPEKENSGKITWNPDAEYEVEKIIGHYRDKKKKLFYLVKWKNWPKEYNTYEPIENLTQCNYALLKYFKKREPSPTEIEDMKRLVKYQYRKNSFYQKLIKNHFRKVDLLDFSTNCLNIDKLFKSSLKDFKSWRENIKEEFEYVMECLVCMSDLRDEGMMKRAQNYKICKMLIRERKRQLKSIKEAEEVINKLENVTVKIENKMDLDCFPDFEYLVDLKPGKDVLIPEAIIGCECNGKCERGSKCCGVLAGSIFAYDLSGKLETSSKIPIYECNRRCSCSSQCSNRVVQNGRKIELCIFKTESYGWGVKTLRDIPRGMYVCEYLGELIRSSEVNTRAAAYKQKNISYFFDLDFNPDSGPTMYTIDATKCGNLARFINHSCNPNLLVCPVWIDCLDIDMPRLAFFAKRHIRKQEEITFDYQNAPENVGRPAIKRSSTDDIQCKCKAPNCRQWIFGV